MIYIRDLENKISTMLKQNEDINKDLTLNEINVIDTPLVIDKEKYDIDFYGVKSDDRYRIIIDFTGSIKTIDEKYSHSYSFIYCVPQVIESEERIMKLIKLLKRKYNKNKMNFLINNKSFISILGDEIKKQER